MSSFADGSSTSFKFAGMTLLTLLVVLPPACILSGIVINGYLSTINVLPLLALVCTISFFVFLEKKQISIYRQAIILSLLLIVFSSSISIFFVLSM